MTTFDPQIPGTFHLKDGLFFRRVERRCLPRQEGLAESKNTENGGPNGNRAQPGIWWDVEVTKCEFVRETETSGHYEIVAQQLIDEGSWLSVVSSMGAAGETTLTYGIATALHRSGNLR